MQKKKKKPNPQHISLKHTATEISTTRNHNSQRCQGYRQKKGFSKKDTQDCPKAGNMQKTLD